MSGYPGLFAFLVLCVGGGLAIGSVTRPGEWYAGLAKPSFNPPNWVFAPAWTILYFLIAVAGWLVWRQDFRGLPMVLWALQLVLNFLWSPVFFWAHRTGVALVVILLLLTTIVLFVLFAWPTLPAAAALFLPYMAWVAFASLLTATIWRLN